MLGFLGKLLGGNKSEKDVKLVAPLVQEINGYFDQCQSLSNDHRLSVVSSMLWIPGWREAALISVTMVSAGQEEIIDQIVGVCIILLE